MAKAGRSPGETCLLRNCGGHTGERPVGVMTKQPRSWWPGGGETGRSKRHDEVVALCVNLG